MQCSVLCGCAIHARIQQTAALLQQRAAVFTVISSNARSQLLNSSESQPAPVPIAALQVQRDYEELPADAVPQLRDSILALLLRFGKGTPAVRTQLCLAMAALAAHLPAAQWSEGGVLRWLMERFAGQDPEIALGCMLELLTVLPQVS